MHAVLRVGVKEDGQAAAAFSANEKAQDNVAEKIATNATVESVASSEAENAKPSNPKQNAHNNRAEAVQAGARPPENSPQHLYRVDLFITLKSKDY